MYEYFIAYFILKLQYEFVSHIVIECIYQLRTFKCLTYFIDIALYSQSVKAFFRLHPLH